MGKETIVDENVRCVIEFDPNQLSVTNPNWPEPLENIVDTAA